MDFPFFKNASPIFFYFISIVATVLANISKEINITLYYGLLIFAVILIYAAYGIIRDALRILIDATPARIDINLIEQDLKAIKGVKATHHLHARTVGGGIETFSGHLVVSNSKNTIPVLTKAKSLLEKKYGFSLSTIQVEDESIFERDPKEIEYQYKEKHQ